jgi:hypothetical protein
MFKQFNLKKLKIEVEYEKENSKIVDGIVSGKITVSQARKELNKNLGSALVKLSDLKLKN